MQYQLVIQFAAESAETFNELLALTEIVSSRLESHTSAQVDGHYFGMGEFNIFIHTDIPLDVLDDVGEIIQESRPGLPFAAGYRDFNEDEYVVLWPKSLKRFFVA